MLCAIILSVNIFYIVLNGVVIKCGKKELVNGIYNVSMDYLLTSNITDFTPYNVTCLAESSAFSEGALATAAIKKQGKSPIVCYTFLK